MRNKSFSIAAGLALVAAVAVPALATDLTPQQVNRVDVTSLADGYRASKIIGAPVVNEANESIGKVDDVLVGRNDKVLYSVLSVGGFLGVGSKLIAVPYQSLQVSDTKMVLPGGNKDTLKQLPEFKYATK
ncbi:MAG: photosystem reaction center subunit [Rhodospirillales bacterium]|nr:photosystem reaction center subunit [Rhodospirillales bacterium]